MKKYEILLDSYTQSTSRCLRKKDSGSSCHKYYINKNRKENRNFTTSHTPVPIEKMVGSKRERLKEIIRKRALLVINNTEIVLTSGMKTNFFFDMKAVLLYPESANLITDAILKKLLEENIQFDYLGGMESGSIPIISLVCANSTAILGRNIEGFYVRKKEKDHGAKKLSSIIISRKIEGNLKSGASVVIVDDVTTTGSSIIEVVNEVEKACCEVVKVITIVDRCQGAKEFILAERQIELDALFTANEFGL